MNQHREKFLAPVTPERNVSDTGYFLEYLAGRKDVWPGPVGDGPSSPHRQVHKIKAKVYAAGAIEDGNSPTIRSRRRSML